MNVFGKSEIWIQYIKQDIFKKYSDDDPHFFINEKHSSTQEAIAWFDKMRLFHWVWYKKYDFGYELKCFPPAPPRDVCQKEINNFLASLDQPSDQCLFQLSRPEIYYNEHEIRHELLRILMFTHMTKITIEGTSKKGGCMVYHLRVVEDSLENMVKAGLLYFEYNDTILNCYATGGKGYVQSCDLP